MNEEVRKIVDSLFENITMNEELRSLREELLDNCQEHFDDLTANGFSAAEAAEEIRDGLSGMEEVIAESVGARKEEKTPEAAGPAAEKPAKKIEAEDIPVRDGQWDEASGELDLPVGALKRMTIHGISEDIRFLPSDDGLIHVEWDPSSGVVLTVVRTGPSLHLSVRRETPGSAVEKTYAEEGTSFDFSIQGFIRLAKKGLKTGLMAMKTVLITVSLPAGFTPDLEVTSRSGDIRLIGAPAHSAVFQTASGDIEAESTENWTKADLRTTSGDISLQGAAGDVKMSSISGDIDFHGTAACVDTRTTSGDVELSCSAVRIQASSISGDVDLACREEPQEVTLRSTSGDVDLALPNGMAASFSLKSTSGDIRNSHPDTGNGAKIEIRTISGDIDVR